MTLHDLQGDFPVQLFVPAAINIPHAALAEQFPGLSIRFMTVHASKGLEADHVIILRAVSDTMGFPSEIVDDPLPFRKPTPRAVFLR